MPADLVVHADWATAPRKRWAAAAVRRADGRYEVQAPHRVDLDAGVLEGLTRGITAPGDTVLMGFDFVVGLPRAYAERVGVTSMRDLLPRLGFGPWREFFEVAERPEEVSVWRPFYPARPGRAAKEHLTAGLGVGPDDLLRRCEQPTPHRPGGSELFWTLGGKQVGKATIAGWREVLQPLIADRGDVRLWPFDGRLADLLAQPGIVVAETYPAEAAVQLGARLSGSKRDREVRRGAAGPLLEFAAGAGVELTDEVRAQIAGGFGDDAAGEDRFDAVLGLLGMLAVVLGERPEGRPDDAAVTAVEGWILGLDPAEIEPAPVERADAPRGPRFVVARNPEPRSKLPYVLSIPVDGGPLVLKAREPWPRTSKVYCHPADGWPADAEVVDSAPAVLCERRGKAIDLVLDRPSEKRSQFVFTRARGREMIFWQTPRTQRGSRPGVRIPSARASGQRDLPIVADTRERYAYKFTGQQASVERRALAVGDYAVEVDGRVVAAVERKSLADLAARLVDGELAFTMAELSALPHAAVVVEAAYADLFKLEHVQPGFVADQLARVQVRHPSVPVVFCGTRKLAEEWTFRFLGAARAQAGEVTWA